MSYPAVMWPHADDVIGDLKHTNGGKVPELWGRARQRLVDLFRGLDARPRVRQRLLGLAPRP
jgi:hypothetical protein